MVKINPLTGLLATVAFAIVATLFIQDQWVAQSDYTKRSRVDEMGSPGIEIRRTIDLQNSTDDVMEAVNRSLHAQQDLCRNTVYLKYLTIERDQDTITYTARVAC